MIIKIVSDIVILAAGTFVVFVVGAFIFLTIKLITEQS